MCQDDIDDLTQQYKELEDEAYERRQELQTEEDVDKQKGLLQSLIMLYQQIISYRTQVNRLYENLYGGSDLDHENRVRLLDANLSQARLDLRSLG